MQYNTLVPPNLQTLSDDVIGNVIPRPRTSLQSSWLHQLTSMGIATNEVPTHDDRIMAVNSVSMQNLVTQISPLVGRKRSFAKYAVENRDIDKREDLSRERRRKNQERYRKRQQKLKEDLEKSTQHLQKEIEELSRQRHSMSCGITTKTTMWSTAVEYFRVFQRGLNSSDEMQLVDLNILKTAMAPDLDAGTVRGFKNLVKSWKVFSNAFQEVRVQLGRLDQTSETSLMATTTTSITITENSLTTMFPYLSARVAAKILGHRLVLRGSMLFEWDSINNHVARLSFQADMMSPILELLGNLEDVSLVFTDARIRPDCNLVNEV